MALPGGVSAKGAIVEGGRKRERGVRFQAFVINECRDETRAKDNI